MNRYEGKVCLVTASTAGIGFGIAKRMLQEGGHVVICSRKQTNVDEALTKLRAEIGTGKGTVDGLPVNVGKVEERAKLLAFIKNKFGRIDVLVPNAAVSTHFGN